MTNSPSSRQWRRATLGAISALSLVACDQLSSQTTKQVPAEFEKVGRYAVVPATSNPVMNQRSPFLFAWRLDTQTGALQMCTYDPGGWTNTATKMPMPETLNCTPPKSAARPGDIASFGQEEIEAEIRRRGLDSKSLQSDDDPLGIRPRPSRRAP